MFSNQAQEAEYLLQDMLHGIVDPMFEHHRVNSVTLMPCCSRVEVNFSVLVERSGDA